MTGSYLLHPARHPPGRRVRQPRPFRPEAGPRGLDRLVFPDGRSFDLHGLPGVDLSAAAGHDKVNKHFVRTFAKELGRSKSRVSKYLALLKAKGALEDAQAEGT